jgi:hypothetical protein
MVTTSLYNFGCVNFLFYTSLVLTVDKAALRFFTDMKCHTNHYSLLTVKWVSFSHPFNCFSGPICTDIDHLLRLLSDKLLHMFECTNILPIYWHILIT